MAKPRNTFDVQLRHEGRWVIEAVEETELRACKVADSLLAASTSDAVRVVRNWTRPDGLIAETEVFCRTRVIRDQPWFKVGQIEQVPARCVAMNDYFAHDSRQTIGRLLRRYLDKIIVTPTELIHSAGELRRLDDKFSLVRLAVDRVATLQAGDQTGAVRLRRDELYQTIDQIAARARAADQLRLPELDGKVSDLIRVIEAGLDPDECDYRALAVLSRQLLSLRSWMSKLELLCRLAAEEDDPHAIALLDGVITDVLGTDVVEDLFGRQPALRTALCAMLDLADGTLASGRTGDDAITASLNRLLAVGKLPASRRCLVERVHRRLRLPGPFQPRDTALEHDEFCKMADRLLTPSGLHSGAETAEALTTRYGRMVERGGAAGRRDAIRGVLYAMPDRAGRLIYLCELARSNYAREHLADMAELLDELTTGEAGIGQLCDRRLAPRERMARATVAWQAMAASPYPGYLKEQVAAHIDDILMRYLIDGKIIEKLDRPDTPLRDRAMHLMRFYGFGLLPKESRAFAAARKTVVSLLRQPDFEARFVAGITDPHMAQATLREFFALLTGTGVLTGAGVKDGHLRSP